MHENFTTFTYFCDLGPAQFLFTPAQLLWYSSTTATCIAVSIDLHYLFTIFTIRYTLVCIYNLVMNTLV